MFCNTSSAETGQGVVGVEAERSEGNIRVHLCTMDYVGRAAILGAHGGGGGWMHEYALEYVGMLYGSGEERPVEGILAEGGSTCRHQVRYVPLCELCNMGYDLLGKIYHGNVGRDRG